MTNPTSHHAEAETLSQTIWDLLDTDGHNGLACDPRTPLDQTANRIVRALVASGWVCDDPAAKWSCPTCTYTATKPGMCPVCRTYGAAAQPLVQETATNLTAAQRAEMRALLNESPKSDADWPLIAGQRFAVAMLALDALDLLANPNTRRPAGGPDSHEWLGSDR